MFVVFCATMGLTCGLIITAAVKPSGRVVLLDALFGVVGALLGGFLFWVVGEKPVIGVSLWGLVAPMAGAFFLLATFHTVAPRHRGLRIRP